MCTPCALAINARQNGSAQAIMAGIPIPDPAPSGSLSWTPHPLNCCSSTHERIAAGWIGLWIIFGHPNPVLIAAVAAVALGIHLFVLFYEEPTLLAKFGDDYAEYCRNVPRWWPRIRAWRQEGA